MTDTAPASNSDRPALWSVARDAYLAGATARTVCGDLKISRTTFYRHAAEEGWLRRDQAALAPPALDLSLPPEPAAVSADAAWRRMTQAVALGRSTEAQRWLKLHAALSEVAERQARAAEPDDPDSLQARIRRSLDAQLEAMKGEYADYAYRPPTDGPPADAPLCHADFAAPGRDRWDSNFTESQSHLADRPPNRAERRRLARLGAAPAPDP